MAMQTIPSRLTIWTSFKGLPTASPFFRAKRNDAARRSDGTGKFQSPWGGTLGQPHGLFNFPALIRTPLADLLACALRRRCRPLRPMPVAAAGVFSPSALTRGTLALFLHISFFKLCSVTAIFLLRKQKIRCLCNFFAIADSLLSFQIKTGCRSADLLRFCA